MERVLRRFSRRRKSIHTFWSAGRARWKGALPLEFTKTPPGVEKSLLAHSAASSGCGSYVGPGCRCASDSVPPGRQRAPRPPPGLPYQPACSRSSFLTSSPGYTGLWVPQIPCDARGDAVNILHGEKSRQSFLIIPRIGDSLEIPGVMPPGFQTGDPLPLVGGVDLKLTHCGVAPSASGGAGGQASPPGRPAHAQRARDFRNTPRPSMAISASV